MAATLIQRIRQNPEPNADFRQAIEEYKQQ